MQWGRGGLGGEESVKSELETDAVLAVTSEKNVVWAFLFLVISGGKVAKK